MRCAIVGSGTRNARAISSVVRPPSRRSVSATRASRRQHRMAGGEHQAQQVVADHRRRPRFRDRRSERGLPVVVVIDGRLLARVQLVLAQTIDRAALGRRHQPCAGFVGHAAGGPVFERGDERVLRQFFGQADVAHHARQAGDQPGDSMRHTASMVRRTWPCVRCAWKHPWAAMTPPPPRSRNRRWTYQQPPVVGVRTFRSVSFIVPHLSFCWLPLGVACSV